jgi:cation diffusion facilitator family transporter
LLLPIDFHGLSRFSFIQTVNQKMEDLAKLFAKTPSSSGLLVDSAVDAKGIRKKEMYMSFDHTDTCSITSRSQDEDPLFFCGIRLPSLRRTALEVSLYLNLLITVAKLVAYVHTLSLSVLAALLDSVLDVVSQMVLNYTEKHSTMQRSSALYPAGASRLEPVGVLTCAALMGMASFEVLKQSLVTIIYHHSSLDNDDNETSLSSFWSMLLIVVMKLALLWLCNRAANKNTTYAQTGSARAVAQLADPTLEALAQDHWNDALSNSVAAVALLCALKTPSLWFIDPAGAILISVYIIHSWYVTGREQIEHLLGKAAPEEFIEELMEIASTFDDRMTVDHLRVYHYGPKFLVELEMVMARDTLLFESHDLGMELQYEIEGREVRTNALNPHDAPSECEFH